MILDDHEIENNWFQNRTKTITRSSSCSITPRLLMKITNGAIRRAPSRNVCIIHSSCNGYPFFVLDTRTQRYMDESAGKPEQQPSTWVVRSLAIVNRYS